MSFGISAEIIIWIIAIVTVILLVTIWGIYKLIAYFRGRRNAEPAVYSESLDSTPVNSDPGDKLQSVAYTIDSDGNVNPARLPRDEPSSGKEQPSTNFNNTLQSKFTKQRKRYIDYQGHSDGAVSSDRVLQDSLNKSLTSNKSIKSKIREMRSNTSKKSLGFEPTFRLVEPIANREKTGNFLEILDKLSTLDDEDEEEKRENERRKRRRQERQKNAVYTASSAGIEANPSDETTSQTFIGKDPEARPDPGRIHLGLIKLQEPDLTSEG